MGCAGCSDVGGAGGVEQLRRRHREQVRERGGGGGDARGGGAGGGNSGGTAPASGGATVAAALPGRMPAHPDAIDVKQSGGTVTFRAPDSWMEVSEYCLKASEQAGFQLKRAEWGRKNGSPLPAGPRRST